MNEKVSLSSYTKKEYNAGAGIMKIIVWNFINVLFIRNPLMLSSSVKIFVLSFFGAKIGKGVIVKQGVNIKYPWKLTIMPYAWIGENVWIDNLADVSIGENSCISQGAFLLTGNHNYKRKTFDLIIGPILLEDGVWIGAKSVVCPGITCKSHSVLTVGSVATSDLEEYSIYQGNPAEFKKNRVVDI